MKTKPTKEEKNRKQLSGYRGEKPMYDSKGDRVWPYYFQGLALILTDFSRGSRLWPYCIFRVLAITTRRLNYVALV